MPLLLPRHRSYRPAVDWLATRGREDLVLAGEHDDRNSEAACGMSPYGVQYGAEKWKCALCDRERVWTDLARMYVGDDYFMLCHGVDDESPTCYEGYQRGRKNRKVNA